MRRRISLCPVRETLGRLPLAVAAPTVVAATIVVFSLGSSSVPDVVGVGRWLRWVLLGVLLAVSLAYALVQQPVRPPSRAPLVLAAALVVLAAASALWSVAPGLTLQRAASLAVLVAASWALARASAGRPRVIESLVLGVLAGVGLVAAAGLIVLAVEPGYAVQWANHLDTPWRYRGLGQNPNTVPMLAALGLPLAGWLALGRGEGRRRLAGWVLLLLFYGTIATAGSRGAIVAGFAALLLLILTLKRSWSRRLGLIALVAVAFAGSQAVNQARTPEPLPPQGAERVVVQRAITASNGRWAAWQGAFHAGSARPVFGHGFGTEERVFVNRYFPFQGNRAENSYLGLYLQLGAAGVALFVALALTLAAVALRGLSRLGGRERGLLAAAAASFLAGLCLAVFQSYVYSVGNIATVSFWTIGFLVAAAAAGAPAGERAVAARPVARRGLHLSRVQDANSRVG